MRKGVGGDSAAASPDAGSLALASPISVAANVEDPLPWDRRSPMWWPSAENQSLSGILDSVSSIEAVVNTSVLNVISPNDLKTNDKAHVKEAINVVSHNVIFNRDAASNVTDLTTTQSSLGFQTWYVKEGNWSSDLEPLETPYNWPFLALLLLVVTGGLGNVLVCLAICLERRLQNVTNYFLLSLAVADLLVCVAVMPFGIADEFYGQWPFGWQVCNFWVTCDVLSCSSSIIHMCFISLGRYLGIRNPLKTRANSKKTVLVKIACVWLVSMVITSPITVLAFVDPRNIQPEPGVCAINNRFFFVFGSLFAFYVPMVIMVASYVLTVQLLQRKAKFCLPTEAGRTGQVQFSRSSQTGRLRCHPPPANGHLPTEDSVQCEKCGHRMRPTKSVRHTNQTRARLRSPPEPTSPGMIRLLGATAQVKNEQKASKVLGLVFFAFVICWTPFFILNILFAVMGPDHLPDYLATTFLWLGYMSSTINPLIYTIFNRTFKRAFWKLLTCKCGSFGQQGRFQTAGDMATWGFKSAHRMSIRTTTC